MTWRQFGPGLPMGGCSVDPYERWPEAMVMWDHAVAPLLDGKELGPEFRVWDDGWSIFVVVSTHGPRVSSALGVRWVLNGQYWEEVDGYTGDATRLPVTP